MADPATPDVTGASSTPIAESTAPVQSGDVLERLSPTEHTEWKLTGKLPNSSTDADSSPAEPGEQAEPALATDSQTVTPPKPKKNADTRQQQIQERIRAEANKLRELREARIREEGRLEALKPKNPDVRRDSSPATADPDTPAFAFPSFDEYAEQHPDATYEAYIDARTDARSTFNETRKQALSQHAERETELVKHVESFRKQFVDDPTLISQIAPAVREITPTSLLPKGTTPNGLSEIGERFLKSPVGLPLMRHFSNHPEDLQRFSTYGPDEFYMELGVLERELKGAAGTTPAKPAASPTKTVTSFSAPVTTLGNRPADAGDPMKAALARGDFAAYRDLKNKADLAANR